MSGVWWHKRSNLFEMWNTSPKQEYKDFTSWSVLFIRLCQLEFKSEISLELWWHWDKFKCFGSVPFYFSARNLEWPEANMRDRHRKIMMLILFCTVTKERGIETKRNVTSTSTVSQVLAPIRRYSIIHLTESSENISSECGWEKALALVLFFYR